MRRISAMVLLACTLAIGSGCTTTASQPQCHGPWSPINPQQVKAHG
ncbi:MAG: hypothetical protein JSR54_00355 [Proteobacteria bacterium]|nr:hypothetical protein [Pseudomonadota bacterium]